MTTDSDRDSFPLFNPFDPGFRVDPYPTYKKLLDSQPVHRNPIGMVVFARYDDCISILRDARFSADSRKSSQFQDQQKAARERGFIDSDIEARPFLFLDPPDHTRLRGLVQKAFTPKRVNELRPHIQELVDELIDQIEARARETGERKMELIEDLAYPLPVQVISEMMGVPTEDRDTFKDWSRDLARSLDPDFALDVNRIETMVAARDAFVDYFDRLIAQREREPRDDLLTALVNAEHEGGKLSRTELMTTLILLLVAGHETTVNLIANGVLALLRNRDQLEKWQSNPEIAKTAVEELLRYDPPIQFTGRLALERVEVGGFSVEKDEFAVALLAAANRDPSHFEKPDRLDLTREPNPHLAFGTGIHHCLGAPLARVEGQIAIGALIRRLPKMELLTEAPEYKENIVLRGMASLPVAF